MLWSYVRRISDFSLDTRHFLMQNNAVWVLWCIQGWSGGGVLKSEAYNTRVWVSSALMNVNLSIVSSSWKAHIWITEKYILLHVQGAVDFFETTLEKKLF